MSLTLAITPHGDLEAISDPESLPPVSEQVALRLKEEFARANAGGLLFLASQEVGATLPPAVAFWQAFARSCQHSELPASLTSRLGE
jgi:hypothetical protein